MVKKIREHDQSVKVIFLTSHTDTKTLLASSTLKLTKYLEKPITKESLLGAIDECKKELHIIGI